MSQIVGGVEGPVIEVQYAAKKQHVIELPGDLSGSTIVFKAWPYSGASLSIDRDATSASHSGGVTTVTFDLTAADCTLNFSRGRYSIHDETNDYIKLEGPFIVKHVPVS